ncbi:MAG: hypothetical protein AAF328_05125 [Planctomycetota bacterium]
MSKFTSQRFCGDFELKSDPARGYFQIFHEPGASVCFLDCGGLDALGRLSTIIQILERGPEDGEPRLSVVWARYYVFATPEFPCFVMRAELEGDPMVLAELKYGLDGHDGLAKRPALLTQVPLKQVYSGVPGPEFNFKTFPKAAPDHAVSLYVKTVDMTNLVAKFASRTSTAPANLVDMFACRRADAYFGSGVTSFSIEAYATPIEDGSEDALRRMLAEWLGDFHPHAELLVNGKDPRPLPPLPNPLSIDDADDAPRPGSDARGFEHRDQDRWNRSNRRNPDERGHRRSDLGDTDDADEFSQ